MVGVVHDQLARTGAGGEKECDSTGLIERFAPHSMLVVGHHDLPAAPLVVVHAYRNRVDGGAGGGIQF